MKNPRHIVAVIAGLLLACGWFIFTEPDRWNLGRIIFGIGMSIVAVWTMICQPTRMTRLAIVIIFLPLLIALVVFEALEPTAGWPVAMAWSALLLGTLFLHAYLHRSERGTCETGESDKPEKPSEATKDAVSE